jgi:hypothetical protein
VFIVLEVLEAHADLPGYGSTLLMNYSKPVALGIAN